MRHCRSGGLRPSATQMAQGAAGIAARARPEKSRMPSQSLTGARIAAPTSAFALAHPSKSPSCRSEMGVRHPPPRHPPEGRVWSQAAPRPKGDLEGHMAHAAPVEAMMGNSGLEKFVGPAGVDGTHIGCWRRNMPKARRGQLSGRGPAVRTVVPWSTRKIGRPAG